VRRVLPVLLAAAFALWSWPLSRDSVIGFGDDPLFNLWSFETAWHNLSSHVPLLQAPLYGGSPLGLAWSENQLAPAILFWPLRSLAANGALALNGAAVILSLLAFFCGSGWLRSLGLGELAPWGGLLFAGCGWLQSQAAHAQNVCLFVLPLAFWSWEAFKRDPKLWRLLLCGAAFGWIGAWNLYFQIFADACLAVWALRARRPAPLLLAFVFQLPILWPYLELGRSLGGFTALSTYGASWKSLLGSAHRPRFLLPSFEVEIEAAGYLGPFFIALLLYSFRRRESRPWLLAAGAAFWVALGRGFGLFDLLAVLPGVSGLRAIGRAQVLVLLFSLPAALGLLQSLPRRWAFAALAVVMLDWLPASRSERVAIDEALYGPPTPLSRALSASDDALLVLPAATPRFMLDATQSWTPYFGGYSGRAPAGEELLSATSDPEAALDLTRARRVLALTSEAAQALRSSPRVREIGCFPHLDLRTPCLFEASASQLPALRLDADAEMFEIAQQPWPIAELRARRAGALDIAALDGCRMQQTIHMGGLSYSRETPLKGLRGVRFGAGETILRVEAKQWLVRAAHAPVTFRAICSTREAG